MQQKLGLTAIMGWSGGLLIGMIDASVVYPHILHPDKSQLPSGTAFGMSKTNGNGNHAHEGG